VRQKQLRKALILVRAGLKSMQPMQLHWAPRLAGARTMVVEQVVYFYQILLVQEN